MPPSARPTTPGPSNVSQVSKRTMSDQESASQDPKKARRSVSIEPSARRRESNRDAKRRRRKKKKTPIVAVGAAKVDAPQARLGERSRAPLSVRNQVIRFTSPPLEAACVALDVKDSPHTSSSKHLGKCRASSLPMDDASERRCDAASTLVRPPKSFTPRDAYPPNRRTRDGLFLLVRLLLVN